MRSDAQVLEVAANARNASPFERSVSSRSSERSSEAIETWRRDLQAGAVRSCDHVLKFFGSFADPNGTRPRRGELNPSRCRTRSSGRIAATRRGYSEDQTERASGRRFGGGRNVGGLQEPRPSAVGARAGEAVGLVLEYMNAGSLDQFVFADASDALRKTPGDGLRGNQNVGARAGARLNISAKFWRISSLGIDERSVPAQATASRPSFYGARRSARSGASRTCTSTASSTATSSPRTSFSDEADA